MIQVNVATSTHIVFLKAKVFTCLRVASNYSQQLQQKKATV